MADYAELYDRILPYLPGAELPVVNLIIQRTARDFLRGSAVWQETLLVPTVTAQRDYVLSPTAAGARPSSVLWVRENSRDIPVVPEGLMRRMTTTPGVPYGWYSEVPTILTLLPTPDAVYNVTVRVVLTLTVASAQSDIPEVLTKDYPEEVASGVLANMLLMPGKPWTNTNTAGLHAIQYAKAIRAIRAIAREGGRPGSSTVRGIRFGA